MTKAIFWFVDDEKSKEIIYTDLKTDSLTIADILLKERSVLDTGTVVKMNDSVYFFTLEVESFCKKWP